MDFDSVPKGLRSGASKTENRSPVDFDSDAEGKADASRRLSGEQRRMKRSSDLLSIFACKIPLYKCIASMKTTTCHPPQAVRELQNETLLFVPLPEQICKYAILRGE